MPRRAQPAEEVPVDLDPQLEWTFEPFPAPSVASNVCFLRRAGSVRWILFDDKFTWQTSDPLRGSWQRRNYGSDTTARCSLAVSTAKITRARERTCLTGTRVGSRQLTARRTILRTAPLQQWPRCRIVVL